MSLLIHRPDVNGQTGQIRFKVQVTERHPETGVVSRGPVETIAIYPRALANIIGGAEMTPDTIRAALRKWMEPRHSEMLLRKRTIEMTTAVVTDLTGKTLEFD